MKQYPSRVAAALTITAIGLTSCADHHPRIAFASPGSVGGPGKPSGPALTNDGRVILVTLDGVREEDVFSGADPSLRPDVDVAPFARPEGLMPRTYALVATRGVALGKRLRGCGTVRTASGANVSLPGYLEIFSGHKTRCRDNACAPTQQSTVLDEAAAAGLTVASIGSWDLLDRAVSRGDAGAFVQTGTHRWPGTRPMTDARLEQLVAAGERSDPFPGVGGYRPDRHTMAIALRYLNESSPEMLHVGLGDADEWGHRDDYGAYLRAIGEADAFIGRLADTLDSMGEVGARTTVLVTTDHGRNRDFRHHGAASDTSARAFVLAFGGRVPIRGVACASRNLTLADIAPTVRALVGLPADESAGAGRAIDEIVAPTIRARRVED